MPKFVESSYQEWIEIMLRPLEKKIIFYHNALDESSYAAITRKGDHPSYSLTFINLISHPHKLTMLC